MATQEQKDRKLATAERAETAASAKVAKIQGKLTALEASYTEQKSKLEAELKSAEQEHGTAAEAVNWVRQMPVSPGNTLPIERPNETDQE
jgi:hypothetical protein